MGFRVGRENRKGFRIAAGAIGAVAATGIGIVSGSAMQQAEIERMRPVVDAAVEFSNGDITPEQLRHTVKTQGYIVEVNP